MSVGVKEVRGVLRCKVTESLEGRKNSSMNSRETSAVVGGPC